MNAKSPRPAHVRVAGFVSHRADDIAEPTPFSLQSQLIAMRFGLRAGRAALIALLAFGEAR